eukprot:snap_masked-scaffold_3-processed-gene-3.35-mRNA-1 protein AED:1.00 eAED:1.00 QI:0/0/0/0/1/1/2/0/70
MFVAYRRGLYEDKGNMKGSLLLRNYVFKTRVKDVKLYRVEFNKKDLYNKKQFKKGIYIQKIKLCKKKGFL